MICKYLLGNTDWQAFSFPMGERNNSDFLAGFPLSDTRNPHEIA
jgi:hypothetical protein